MPTWSDTRSLEAPALADTPPESRVVVEAPARAPLLEARERFSPAFSLLCVYMVLLFLRPHDYLPALAAFHLPFLVGALCAAAHVLESLGASRSLVPLSPAGKTLAALTVWMLLGLPLAFWKGGALQTITGQWLKMLVLFALLAVVVSSPERLRRILWVCTLCVVAVSALAMAGFAPAEAAVDANRLSAGLGGPYSGVNYFSFTLLTFLPFALLSFFFDPDRWTRRLAGLAAAILAAANMLTNSRMGAIGFLLILVLVGSMWRQWGRGFLTLALAALLGSVLFLALAPDAYWSRMATLVREPTTEELAFSPSLQAAVGSEQERAALLGKAVTLTLENPLFGVGAGNFTPAAAARWNTGSGRDWLVAHNTYLQVSAELGLPALALYLLLLALIFLSLRRTRSLLRRLPDSPLLRRRLLLRDTLLAMFVVFLFAACFASVAYDANLFLVAGLAEALRRQGPSPPATPESEGGEALP